MKEIWKALRENPVETAILFVGVGLGIVLGLSTILGYSNVGLASGITLELLAIIAGMLFFIRGATSRVHQATQETTTHLQTLENHLADARLHPYRVSEVVVPYCDKLAELENDLKHADRVWVLSRTCRRVWSDFNRELEGVAQKGELRFLLLDPTGHALGLTTEPATWDKPEDRDLLRRNVERFVSFLQELCEKNGLHQFAVRKIDYLPAWTLILVNPGEGPDATAKGKAYIEMATYRADPRKRPCLTVSSERDPELFAEFRDEYRQMWDKATGAW